MQRPPLFHRLQHRSANSPQSEQERKGKVLYFEISALMVPTSENLLKEENPTEAFSSVSSQPAEVRKTESDKQEAAESVSTRTPTCRAPAIYSTTVWTPTRTTITSDQVYTELSATGSLIVSLCININLPGRSKFWPKMQSTKHDRQNPTITNTQIKQPPTTENNIFVADKANQCLIWACTDAR